MPHPVVAQPPHGLHRQRLLQRPRLARGERHQHPQQRHGLALAQSRGPWRRLLGVCGVGVDGGGADQQQPADVGDPTDLMGEESDNAVGHWSMRVRVCGELLIFDAFYRNSK